MSSELPLRRAYPLLALLAFFWGVNYIGGPTTTTDTLHFDNVVLQASQ